MSCKWGFHVILCQCQYSTKSTCDPCQVLISYQWEISGVVVRSVVPFGPWSQVWMPTDPRFWSWNMWSAQQRIPSVPSSRSRWRLGWGFPVGVNSSRCFWWTSGVFSQSEDGLQKLVGGDWTILYFFHIYWECHHPNWLSFFFRGVQTTNQETC